MWAMLGYGFGFVPILLLDSTGYELCANWVRFSPKHITLIVNQATRERN